MLASYMDVLFDFCDRAVSGGYVVAMALICATQYLYHLHNRRKTAELKERLCRQIDDVQTDLRVVSRDRTLTSLENQILREFTGELDLDRTLEHLMRRLVADTKDGISAYVALGTTPAAVTHSRGLSEKSREALVIDGAFLKRVAKGGVTVIRKAELFGSQLYDGLSPGDRARFDQIFLAGVGDSEKLAGVVLATSLIPPGIPLDQQIELARRLMQSLTGIVKRTEELQDRDRQLQSISEIMELRTITDRKHNSPLDMVEAFLDRLREMLGAERAALFLMTPDGKGPHKPLCRCGIPLPAGSAKKYADFETMLAEMAVAVQSPETFGAAQLERIGVNSLIGSALITPVVSPNGITGALCLTRQCKEQFTAVHPELITWAARYLSETLLRVLHQAVSEWHARQDPLTELSNRRTFDQEFALALQMSSAKGRSCALLMVDIDRFKLVNDRYGHLVGDEVLRCVSRVLKESVARLSSGVAGVAARFGGEEFSVLLPGIDCEEATWIAETIRTSIEVMPIHVSQGHIKVTVSIGVSAYPEYGRTAEELIAVADAALYQAKESGRNQVLTAMAALPS